MPSSQVLTAAYYALWLAGPGIICGLGAVLRRRRLDKEFPFFFKYLVFQVLVNLLLFGLALKDQYRAYFYAYWVFVFVSTVLEFGIIYEIFAHLFRPYPYLRDFARVIFRWAGTLLVLIALLLAVTASGSEGGLLSWVLWAQRSVRLVQCGLVFFLLYFCSYLGITRKHYLFGIALGFGTVASVELAAVATRMVTGYIGDRGLNLVLLAAFDFAACVWLIYFASRGRAAQEQPVIVAAGQKWDYGVAELLYPQAEEGLLSRIDKLVEDAFAHSRAAKSIPPEAAPAVAPIPPSSPPR